MNNYEDAIKTMNDRWKLLSSFQLSIAKTPSIAASKTSFYSRIAQNYSDLNVPFLQNSRSNHFDAMDAAMETQNTVTSYAKKNEKILDIPLVEQYQNFKNPEKIKYNTAKNRRSGGDFIANYDALQRKDHQYDGGSISKNFLEQGYSANSFGTQISKERGKPANAFRNLLPLNYVQSSVANLSSSALPERGRYLLASFENNGYGLYHDGLALNRSALKMNKYDDAISSFGFMRNKHDVGLGGLKASALLSPNYPTNEQRMPELNAGLAGHLTDLNIRSVGKQIDSDQRLERVLNFNNGRYLNVSAYADNANAPLKSLQNVVSSLRQVDSGFDNSAKTFAVNPQQYMNNVGGLRFPQFDNTYVQGGQLKENYFNRRIYGGISEAGRDIGEGVFGSGNDQITKLKYPAANKAEILDGSTVAQKNIIDRTTRDLQKNNRFAQQKVSSLQNAYPWNEIAKKFGRLHNYISNLPNQLFDPTLQNKWPGSASDRALYADNLMAGTTGTGIAAIGAAAKGRFLSETMHGKNPYPSADRGFEFMWDMPAENFGQHDLSALGMPLQTTQNNITVTGNVFERKQDFDPDMIADCLGKMVINEIQNSASGIYD